MKTRLLFALVALASGCTIGKFQSYHGGQQEWPTAPGAFVETVKSIPIYTGFPSKPYEVIGIVSVTIADGWGADGMLNSRLASEAAKHGANAVIRMGSTTAYAGTYNMPGSSQTFGSATATSTRGQTFVTGQATTIPQPGYSFALNRKTVTAWLIKIKE